MSYKLISFFLTVLSLFGCSEYSGNKTVSLPIYEECRDILSKIIKQADGESVLISLNYFDITSEAHSSIVGYAIIKGREGEILKGYVEAAKGVCHPRARIAITQNASGYSAAYRDYLSLSSANNSKEPYIVFTKDEIYLYYNQRILSWWK